MSDNISYIWLVCQYQWDDNIKEWIDPLEICGIFDTEQKAVDSCLDEGYWVVRTELNKALPHGTGTEFIKDIWEPYYPWMKEDGTWDNKPMIRKGKGINYE